MQKDQTDLIDDELEVTEKIRSVLNKTGIWARFLSITGFSMTGMMFLLALFLGYINPIRLGDVEEIYPGQSFSFMGMRVNIVIMAVLLLFPCLFLYRFSAKMKEALQTNTQHSFEDAFSNLKSTFKFYGMLVIILIVLYTMGFLALAVTGLLS